MALPMAVTDLQSRRPWINKSLHSLSIDLFHWPRSTLQAVGLTAVIQREAIQQQHLLALQGMGQASPAQYL